MESLEGVIEEIVFANQKNGYTICDIRQGKKLVTLVGYMPYVSIGETVSVTGVWTVHPDYGEQLKVETCEARIPSETETLEKYLGSGIIKGIGPSTAKKIVDAFKEETIKVIQFDSKRLAEINGITLDKAVLIGQAFLEKEQMRSVIMFLTKFGVSAAYSTKAWKKFGSQAIDELKKNPYRLTDEDVGLPFKTADSVAYALGMDMSSMFRIQCGIKYVLGRAALEGHTYLPENLLTESAARLLKVDETLVENALTGLNIEETIFIETDGSQRNIYLAAFHMAEVQVSKNLMRLSSFDFMGESGKPETGVESTDGEIRQLEKEMNIVFGDQQREAVIRATENGVLVITGGPGTGKTTIIKAIIALFEKQGKSVVLAAPTGRAAKRMTEAAGKEAKTIHRLLEIGYTGDSEQLLFAKSENDPINADVIIIDEMSMVDTLLMNSLMKAIESGSRLIMVGDVDQLPSVGAGRVLADIIESGSILTVKLDEIYRQSEESMIIVNAHRINKGEMPQYSGTEKDFFFVGKPSALSTVDAVVELCMNRIPSKFDYCPMRDIQVLSPSRKGESGVYKLNSRLQQKLNPPDPKKKEKHFRDNVFREGDRVMQVKNNYNLRWSMDDSHGGMECGEGIFNGDLGIIRDINNKEEIMIVEYDDGKTVEYDFDKLEELELAYATTVHKSQGSEFPAVVIPLFQLPAVLMNRNLLYTAVTRAKNLVVIVGSQNILMHMVNNRQERKRYSGLKDKIENEGRTVQ